VEGSPIGTIWDGLFTNVFQGPGGSYTMTNLLLAAQIDRTGTNSSDLVIGFHAEIRLPFADIYQGVPGGHPTNGTQLRLNLNRINWRAPLTPGGPGAVGSDTYHAWSPVPGSAPAFHQPDKFGTVTFSTNSVPAPVWMFTSQILSGTNLVLGGTGHPGGVYRILTSTNISLPMINWNQIGTNTFDAVTGEFSFTNAINSSSPQLFYRLQSL